MQRPTPTRHLAFTCQFINLEPCMLLIAREQHYAYLCGRGLVQGHHSRLVGARLYGEVHVRVLVRVHFQDIGVCLYRLPSIMCCSGILAVVGVGAAISLVDASGLRATVSVACCTSIAVGFSNLRRSRKGPAMGCFLAN